MGARHRLWMPFRPPFLTTGERRAASGERFVKNRPTPSDGGPCVGSGQSIEPTPQGGETAHRGGDVCSFFLCWATTPILYYSVIGHGILAGKYLAEYRDSLK